MMIANRFKKTWIADEGYLADKTARDFRAIIWAIKARKERERPITLSFFGGIFGNVDFKQTLK